MSIAKHAVSGTLLAAGVLAVAVAAEAGKPAAKTMMFTTKSPAAHDQLVELQRRIESFLQENGIPFVDTRDKFNGLQSSKDAFLFADPMHLNETGHRLVFDALLDDWRAK